MSASLVRSIDLLLTLLSEHAQDEVFAALASEHLDSARVAGAMALDPIGSQEDADDENG